MATLGLGYKRPTQFASPSVCVAIPRMSQVSRDQGIGMLMTGATQDDVAKRFRVAPSTISRLQRHFQDTGVTRDRPQPGQPRVTTWAQDRYIHTTHHAPHTSVAGSVQRHRQQQRQGVALNHKYALELSAADSEKRVYDHIAQGWVSCWTNVEGASAWSGHVSIPIGTEPAEMPGGVTLFLVTNCNFCSSNIMGGVGCIAERGERNAAPCVVQQDHFNNK